MDNQTIISPVVPAANPELEINTTTCSQPDAYDISVEIGWFEEWIVWEGGIAFNVIYWLLMLIISFAGLYILRRFFNWKFLSARFVGEDDPSTISVKRNGSWIDWLTLKIDEEAVGKDGATFLWYQLRLIQVDVLRMALGIVLIVMHFYGEKLGESPNKTLRSTGLYNIGINGAHGVFCAAILITLAWLMKQHGQDRSIRSLASHSVNSFSNICNRKCLMISGFTGDNIDIDSLLDYLKSRFDIKGIRRDGIVPAFDISKLLPIVDQLNDVRNIKRHLSPSKSAELIKRRWWAFWENSQSSEMGDTVMHGPEWIQPGVDADDKKEIDVATYYDKQEKNLLAKREAIANNLELSGTVFVRFDSPADARAAKMALRRYQIEWFWKRGNQEDQYFRPSQWTVHYAPPGSEVNWMHLKKPRPAWKTLALWLRLAVTYSMYVILMAAPGSIVRWLHLYEESENDGGSIFWKRFVLPTIVSFFTTKLTDWVTGQDQQRRHLTVSQLCLSSLRSICYLNVVLYLIRMLAMKPLPLLLAGKFHSDDFRLECLFFPVHGSFVACCIIVNTMSAILMNHLRMDFIFSYISKWFTSRSEAEVTNFKKTYRIEYDFAANYAELTCNFALTSFFIMIFPVISLVSFVFSILRFLSDRATMTDMYAISQTGHNLHQEPINMALSFAVASPLALLIYRRIQLGPTTQLLDPGIVAPLSLLILYILFLLYARVKLDGFLPGWFRRLLKLGSRTEASTEDDEDDLAADSMSNIQHEYDPIAKLRVEESIRTKV